MFEDPERLQGVLLESSPGCHVELVHMTVGLPLFTSNSSELELIAHSWNYAYIALCFSNTFGPLSQNGQKTPRKDMNGKSTIDTDIRCRTMSQDTLIC